MAQDGVYVFQDPNGGRSNVADFATIAALNGNGGWGGGMNNPMWMMFMYPFILPFLSMFGGNGWGGFGGWGGNGAAALTDVAGTGYISNQLNNIQGRDLILQAFNGKADAIAQLAQLTNSSVNDVRAGIAEANAKLSSIGERFGLSALQVINEVQNGDATLGRQLCECCCENRLAIERQTNDINSRAATNFAAQQLQTSQYHGEDRLDVCQQTNELKTQGIENTQSIKDAIAAQSIMINEKFCDLEKRELQNKINAQADLITQMRGEISNDRQTEKFNTGFAILNDKLNQIAAKQPNTVPVQYPNLVAVNSTPYFPYGYGNWGQTNFWN